MDSRGRSWLAVGGWLLAAAAATTIGVVAVGAVGTSVVGTTTSPISDQQVNRALARSTPSTSQPTAAPGTTKGGAARALTTPGGTIVARCTAGQATLLAWSPAQGYDAEDVRAGPAPAAILTFETADTEIRVRVACHGGLPTAHTSTQPDHDRDQD